MSAMVARVLRRSAELIEQLDWTQGEGMDRNGRVCSVYAIGLAERETGCFDAGYHAELAMCRHLGIVPWSLPVWNDQTGRTRAEVIKGMLETADLEEFS